MMISPHLIEWHCDCGRKYQAGNDDAVIKQLQQQVEALTKRLQRARLDTVEFIHDEIIDGSETANEARRDVFNYYLKLQLEGKSKQEPASD